jgi:hypothetical protein
MQQEASGGCRPLSTRIMKIYGSYGPRSRLEISAAAELLAKFMLFRGQDTTDRRREQSPAVEQTSPKDFPERLRREGERTENPSQ